MAAKAGDKVFGRHSSVVWLNENVFSRSLKVAR